jgi:hypothetical protein
MDDENSITISPPPSVVVVIKIFMLMLAVLVLWFAVGIIRHYFLDVSMREPGGALLLTIILLCFFPIMLRMMSWKISAQGGDIIYQSISGKKSIKILDIKSIRYAGGRSEAYIITDKYNKSIKLSCFWVNISTLGRFDEYIRRRSPLIPGNTRPFRVIRRNGKSYYN